MRVSLKTIVITGEVTVLVAFTGVGIHLFMQPNRPAAQPPPPLILPVKRAAGVPVLSFSQPAPSKPRASAMPVSLLKDFAPGWFAQLNRDDRTQLRTEWEILRRLIRSVEWFLEHRVVPAMEGRR